LITRECIKILVSLTYLVLLASCIVINVKGELYFLTHPVWKAYPVTIKSMKQLFPIRTQVSV